MVTMRATSASYPPSSSLLLGMVLVVIAMTFVSTEGARYIPLEKFLQGRWLLRPLVSEQWTQPFTHSGVIKAVAALDGEAHAEFVPYEPASDAASNIFLGLTTSVMETVYPWYHYARENAWYYVSLIFYVMSNDPRRVISPSNDILASSRMFGQVDLLANADVDTSCYSHLRSLAWNASIKARIHLHTQTAGTLSLSISDDENIGTHEDLPVSVHYAPTDFQKYRVITSAFEAKKEYSISVMPPPHQQEDSGAHGGLSIPLRSFSIQFLDDSNALVTVVLAPPPASERDQENLHHACFVRFLLRRTSDTEESRSVWSLMGTLALLVVVALIKFGPRQYMKWKGLNPNAFLRGNQRVNKSSPMTAMDRERILRQEADILQSVRNRTHK